jgi:hypothetical protein
MSGRRAPSLPALALALALAASACGEDLTVTPVRNLERPSDLDFVCLAAFPNAGTGGEVVASGQPMSECYLTSAVPGVDGGLGSMVGTSNRITFGLFTNTARSEVGAINMLPDNLGGDRLVDLDRRQPGFNMVPVGTLPERLVSSDDGCKSVTANRGSCDLSVIDNSRLLADTIGAVSSTGPGEIVRRLQIRTGNGQPFWAAPAEVAIVPRTPQPADPTAPPPDGGTGNADAAADGPADAGATDASPADATPSDAGMLAEAATGARQVMTGMCPDERAGRDAGDGGDGAGAAGLHQAVVTFPGCDLVALIDLNTGHIVSSARMHADGTLEDTGPDPVCSAECTEGGPPAGPAADGGASVGSGSGRIGVTALAMHPEAGLVYVGANRSPVIAALAVTPQKLLPQPDIRFALAENPGGVTRLRLSRDPYRVLEGRHFVGPYGSYLYAFAQDGSVRVVSLGVRRECDVNSDVKVQIMDLNHDCLPIGMHPRNVLARGPGLRPPANDPTVGPALPVDIAFTHVNRGGTGFLLTSRGDVFQVGLGYYPPPLKPGDTMPAPAPSDTVHGVRPDPLGGLAKSPSVPTRNFSETSVAFPTRIAFNTADTGPYLQPDELSQGSVETSYLVFPRPERVPGRQQVVVRWEGILPFTQRDSGKLSPSSEGPGGAGTLTDEAGNFCGSGVEVGDVLAMIGCEEDRECEPMRNEVCYRAAPGAQGACLPRSLVADEAWTRLCQSELGSRRRYEIKSVSRTQMALQLKPDEVPRPAIAACNPRVDNDAVCQPDLTHRPDPNLPGDRGFQCLQLPQSPPRCLKPCGVRASAAAPWQRNDELCRAGFVCADMGSNEVGPVCVEGPAPRPECTPLDARYQVQVGRGYTVASTALPFFSRMREGKDGVCEVDPTRPPQLVSRLPLAAPACTSIAPEVTAEKALESIYDPGKEGPAGNPCLFRPGERPATFSAAFENAHFRLVLNNVDSYVGDAAIIETTIDTGFRPIFVAPSRPFETPNLAVRIVTGPMKARTREGEFNPPPPYLFVVDQSRTTSLLSRGKIMRINPYPYLYPPGGHFDSLLTGSLFPIQ